MKANESLLTLNSGLELFPTCLENSILLEGFKVFTKKNWSGENVFFYCEVQEYKKLIKSGAQEQAKEKKDLILKEYIVAGSALEVNLDDRVRKALLKEAEKGEITENLFQGSQHDILKLMEADSFEKWRGSEEFQTCLERAIREIQQQNLV